VNEEALAPLGAVAPIIIIIIIIIIIVSSKY